MDTLLKSQDSGLPLGKIIAGVGVVFALLGLAANWYGDFSAGQKADEFYAAAKDQYHLEHTDTALLKVNEALSLKEKPEYQETKVNILFSQGKFWEAGQLLDKLIQLKPDNANYRYLSATIALNEDELPKGEAQFRKAIEIEPGNPTYAVYLANMLSRQEKWTEAKAQYESILQKDPNYKFAWEQYINTQTNADRYTEALAVEQRALKQFPSDSDFYFLLATTTDHMGQKAEAVAAYRRSLELEPMENSIAAKRIFEITGKRVPPVLEKMTAHQVSFEPRQNLMYVTATVNGQAGQFLLDTGASMCVLYQHAASKYRLTQSPYKAAVETANGIIQVPIGYGDVQLGNHGIGKVVFGLIPDAKSTSIDGIIGMNFLGKFQMAIDKNAHTITLAKGN